MASTDARLTAKKATALRISFPIYDADGDLVSGATALDSEVSKDAGTFADCTNEATEIATNSGIYYLDLTASEMNADTVIVQTKTSTAGAKTAVNILYTNGVHVANDGIDSDSITDAAYSGIGQEVGIYFLDAPAADYNTADTVGEKINEIQSATDSRDALGAKVGTAQSGTSSTIVLATVASSTDDAYNGWIVAIVAGTGVDQKRVVTDYTGSTRTATIGPNWTTNPDSTSRYAVIYGEAL
jgi:hypothetical protein